ncbi:MAG TPA: CDP-diacylglycerol--glycerol-3-phosphate 3-phosphatidyltransferase, partial [Clostridia bacterium]
QITKFGKFLDPIADKLLITAALIALVQRGEAAGWAAMVIIGREFMVTGLRLIAAGEGVVIAAGIWGKIKMVAQIVAIVASLVKFDLYGFDKWTMFIAVVLTIYSGYEYIAKNVNLIDYK